jgi:hypothetical protein
LPELLELLLKLVIGIREYAAIVVTNYTSLTMTIQVEGVTDVSIVIIKCGLVIIA